MKIKLIKFRDDLIPPIRAHYNDAGIDCFAQEDFKLERACDAIQGYAYVGDSACEQKVKVYHDVYIPTDKIVTVPLGFGLEIPNGYMATIRPRSSMNAKGIITQIGTIDSGYRGEIKAILINLTHKDFHFKRGDKICQIVIEPVILADIVEDLGEERGEGGFGSTGR